MAPSLLPLLRSQRMARALAVLYLHPDREYSLTDLARAAGTSPSTLHRDVGYLTESGFVAERTDGRSRKLKARSDHPLTAPLRQLVLASFGPPNVLADELGNVDGIDEQYIYGSWAARYAGEPGHFPNDVDVVVIGCPKRSEVHQAAAAAADRLSLEVNAMVISPERWAAGDDPLVASIRARPMLLIEAGSTNVKTPADALHPAVSDSGGG